MKHHTLGMTKPEIETLSQALNVVRAVIARRPADATLSREQNAEVEKLCDARNALGDVIAMETGVAA